jgi:hypothetical protein
MNLACLHNPSSKLGASEFPQIHIPTYVTGYEDYEKNFIKIQRHPKIRPEGRGSLK